MGFWDFIFFLYFASHIPITILVDSQAVFPKWLYPDQLLEVLKWYTSEYRDPMMADPPVWFKSFCVCEIILQFPFFFVGAYAFWKGAKNCQWIRIPAIVYSSHVATTTIAITAHIFLEDFSKSRHPGPRNMEERWRLFGIYATYLIIPVIMLLKMLFSSDFQKKQKTQ